jgi:hypothetical protein
MRTCLRRRRNRSSPLSLLDASLVSKKVNQLSLDPLLWTRLHLSEPTSAAHFCLRRCRGLFDRCNNLRTLEICGSTSNAETEALVDYAVRNCKRLHRLRIRSDESIKAELGDDVECFSPAMYRTLEEHGHTIRDLHLQECFVKSDDLLEMATLLGRLTTLTLDQGRDSPIFKNYS